MSGLLPKKLVKKFDEEIRFFKGWIDKPKAVGAILPTSNITARRMASIINPASNLPVLELGPGTGVITKAILKRGITPSQLYSVEYSQAFFDHLRDIYPDVNFLRGDAFDLDKVLGDRRDLQFDSVISAVPLLNFPLEKRLNFLDDLLNRIPVGRPVMQISYGAFSPLPVGRGAYSVEQYDFILRNLPPAKLWVYRRIVI